MRRQTLQHLYAKKNEQQKIAMVTLYDATFARAATEVGVDILFVGDSLGMTLKGSDNTLEVTTAEIAYHTKCVAAGNLYSVIMSDLPFMSYYSLNQAAKNSTTLIQAGAEIIKIEGGSWLCETVQFLTQRGIPICAHIGLTPQFIHTLGGFKVQGRTQTQANNLLDAAISLEQAGATMLVVECVPYLLAKEITEAVKIPVIGIGAGPFCDGQVLVIYDLLGLTSGKPKKFVKNFLESGSQNIKEAIKNYADAVHDNTFPTLEHSFE